MNRALPGIVPSVIVLGVLAAVAIGLTMSRGFDPRAGLGGALRASVLALALQAVHFAEELMTGFHERFPELLGFSAMPVLLFVLFNVLWLVIWGLSVAGLRHRMRVALFPLWFLALGSAMNGVAHPLLALAAGTYFPGLITSPLSGAAGIWLITRLASVTAPQPVSSRP